MNLNLKQKKLALSLGLPIGFICICGLCIGINNIGVSAEEKKPQYPIQELMRMDTAPSLEISPTLYGAATSAQAMNAAKTNNQDVLTKLSAQARQVQSDALILETYEEVKDDLKAVAVNEWEQEKAAKNSNYEKYVPLYVRYVDNEGNPTSTKYLGAPAIEKNNKFYVPVLDICNALKITTQINASSIILTPPENVEDAKAKELKISGSTNKYDSDIIRYQLTPESEIVLYTDVQNLPVSLNAHMGANDYEQLGKAISDNYVLLLDYSEPEALPLIAEQEEYKAFVSVVYNDGFIIPSKQLANPAIHVKYSYPVRGKSEATYLKLEDVLAVLECKIVRDETKSLDYSIDINTAKGILDSGGKVYLKQKESLLEGYILSSDYLDINGQVYVRYDRFPSKYKSQEIDNENKTVELSFQAKNIFEDNSGGMPVIRITPVLERGSNNLMGYVADGCNSLFDFVAKYSFGAKYFMSETAVE